MTNKLAVGMDIGGTKIEGSLINEHGEILDTLRLPSLNDETAMLERVADMVLKLAGNHSLEGVGLSIPGSLDENGILRNAPNSPAIDGTPLGRNLAQRLPYPIKLENDANCLAVSEKHYGAARGYEHVVGIILGTGVGGGVLLNGKPLHGWRGLAPEPGHMPLDINGRRCLCGNRGCVEAYLSGPSLLRRYHDKGGSPDVDDTRLLFQRPHDPLALEIIEETRLYFARFIAALISLYDPQVFVLGGGLSLQPMFYEMEAQIQTFCFGTNRIPPILKAERGDASGKLGAAALFLP